MHEEALLRDLRQKLEEIGRDERPAHIYRVRVWIGALSHLTESTLRTRWPEVVEGTSAAAARLEVRSSEDPNDPRARAVVLAEVGLSGPSGDARRAQERARR